MQRVKRFVIFMYSKGRGASVVTTGSKLLENIPPTQATPFHHVKRAIVQASLYWHQATSVQQDIPDFSYWGWQKDGTSTWQQLWSTLRDASMACSFLLHCGCVNAWTGRCKSNRVDVQCTALCKCIGCCVNSVGENRWCLMLKPKIAGKTVHMEIVAISYILFNIQIHTDAYKAFCHYRCFRITLIKIVSDFFTYI